MKILYIDCGMGAAGDMLTAALLELIPDREGFLDEINRLGIPGVSFSSLTETKCGIRGTRIVVDIDGEQEGEYHHGHEHHREEHHHHSDLHGIGHIVEDLPLSQKTKQNVLSVYRLIAEAESHVHGVPVENVHFHEVGTMDAVADITAVCLLLERIVPEKIVVSPVHVGSGQVHCAHGILPVPAPATAHLLRDVPIYGGAIRGELCTPTGAALLKHFATEFGEMPTMKVEKIGYGMGKKDFEAANCVRVMLGEGKETIEDVSEISCNLDDMTPEAVGFAQERLLEEGALEVFTTPAQMKKSRPGWLFTVLCRPEDKERMVSLLFRYTTTLGVRENLRHRFTLSRRVETLSTPRGDLNKKIAHGYGVRREKYEYEDLARIAREGNMTLEEAKDLAQKEQN